MKNRSKIGNRKGNPAYRTPSAFRHKKAIESLQSKSKFKMQKSKFRKLTKIFDF